MEEPRTRLQIIVLIALAAMATLFGAALIISHCAFRGVAFSDTLLRVESSENAVAYTGEVNGITVCIHPGISHGDPRCHPKRHHCGWCSYLAGRQLAV